MRHCARNPTRRLPGEPRYHADRQLYAQLCWRRRECRDGDAASAGLRLTATVTPGTVTQGGTFDLRVAAAIGATPQVTALPVVVTLPNSNPPANVTYTLYVQAVGVPDLQVVSVTPAQTLNSSTPWLSGGGVNFSVVVRNNGNTASAGGEALTMTLNGYQVNSKLDSTQPPPPLAPGASATLQVIGWRPTSTPPHLPALPPR
ncbi:MAG TPA: hypothetical protein VF840_09875 [Terriglobales bacterium]